MNNEMDNTPLKLGALHEQSTDTLTGLIVEACSVLERRLDAGTLRSAQNDSRIDVLGSLEAAYSMLAKTADRLYARHNNEESHVHFFIDYGSMKSTADSSEAYARWVLMYFTLSATLQQLFYPYMKDRQLYCTFENQRWRITGASRLGDVWLSKTLAGTPKSRYDLRVCISDCSEFSPTAEAAVPAKT